VGRVLGEKTPRLAPRRTAHAPRRRWRSARGFPEVRRTEGAIGCEGPSTSGRGSELVRDRPCPGPSSEIASGGMGRSGRPCRHCVLCGNLPVMRRQRRPCRLRTDRLGDLCVTVVNRERAARKLRARRVRDLARFVGKVGDVAETRGHVEVVDVVGRRGFGVTRTRSDRSRAASTLRAQSAPGGAALVSGRTVRLPSNVAHATRNTWDHCLKRFDKLRVGSGGV